ncbi:MULTISPECIES: hypothetical protein [Mycobacterium]|uniref:hypothetical protein n=1 Tax=Mycobacterium TaxID=1763 RepID=UPI0019814A5C|nr:MULTISPECIES: hypothetical protein [Mycobacterium]MDP7706917.1 hypothetical protein [Mycobacterium sp. TY815]
MTITAATWATTSHPDEAQSLPHFDRPDADPTELDCDIDELAVAQVACDGLRLRLRGAERDEAIRRMHGRVATELIAWRLYTTKRTVNRVAARLGLTQHRCGEDLTTAER